MANKEFTKDTIDAFSKQIGIDFEAVYIVREALTHRSYRNEHQDEAHNERLEFIGDAVLELIITEFLFKKYPERPEGDLTSFRSALVRTESLAHEASRLKLGEYLYMSTGEEMTGGRTREYILANAFEALIGLIYLVHGYEAANEFVLKNVSYKIDEIVENRLDIDPKSKLQEIAQEKVRQTPTYSLISSKGPDHNKTFTMAVFIGEHEFATGTGKSKQAAEQHAAGAALKNWENLQKKFFK